MWPFWRVYPPKQYPALSITRVKLAPATRQRVQAAIDQLDYRPNILARNLIHQRSHTLAVIAWGIDYFGPSRTVVGIEQEANELGYALFLSLVSHPTDESLPKFWTP